MPYLLTPTGWKVLSENVTDAGGSRKRRKASAATNGDFETHAAEALRLYAKGNYQKGSIDHTKANLAYLDLPAGARKRHEELRDKLNRAAKAARGEVFEGSAELNESQMELLESLYEDGYLTEEQIDEILAGLARVASSAAGAAGRGLAGATKRVGSAASAGARKVAGAAKAGVDAATAGARKVVGKVTSAYHEGEADAKAGEAAKLRANAAQADQMAAGHRAKAGNLNESQMELLESLYEDGYLSENLLKKALGGIARGAAHVASGAAGVLPIRAGGRRAARAAYNLDNFADRMGEDEPRRRGNRINESQVELLESLYEDGYLTEEQLDEILGKIAGVARDIRSGYLQARALGAVRSSDKKIKQARDALAAIRMSSGEKEIAKAMKNARGAHKEANLAKERANRRLDLAIDDMKNRERRRQGQQNLNENSEMHKSNFKRHAKLAAAAYDHAVVPHEWNKARQHHLRAQEAFLHIPQAERAGEIMSQSKELMRVANDSANRCGINDWKREK